MSHVATDGNSGYISFERSFVEWKEVVAAVEELKATHGLTDEDYIDVEANDEVGGGPATIDINWRREIK